jgi:hypothetical protein
MCNIRRELCVGVGGGGEKIWKTKGSDSVIGNVGGMKWKMKEV